MLKDIIALMGEASGLPKDALASFVKEDGSINEEAVPGLLKQVREGFSAKLKTAGEEAVSKAQLTFDNGYKKAQGEVLDKYEDGLRAELGIDGKLRGKELLAAIKATKGGASTGTITKDEIEKHPFYLDTLENLKKEHGEALKALQGDFEKFKTGVEQEKVHAEVWNRALPIIDESKPAYSEAAAVKEFQMKAIREGILGDHNFEIQGDRIVVLDKDGKLAKDNLGNATQFNDLVVGAVSTRVGTMASDKRESAGVKNGQKTPPKEGAWKHGVPKDQAELNKILTSREYSTEEKTAAQEAFKSSQQKAAA